MKICSLFSGIGGIDLGFLQASYEIVWANEIDKCAADTYKYNLGGNSIVVGDIKNIEANDIPDFDVLAAGFPCQSFSTAGKQRGFDDSRGNLFFQVERGTTILTACSLWAIPMITRRIALPFVP